MAPTCLIFLFLFFCHFRWFLKPSQNILQNYSNTGKYPLRQFSLWLEVRAFSARIFTHHSSVTCLLVRGQVHCSLGHHLPGLAAYWPWLETKSSRDFPGGPVIKARCFQCKGLGFNPCWGTKIQHAMWNCQKWKKKWESGVFPTREQKGKLAVHMAFKHFGGTWDGTGLSRRKRGSLKMPVWPGGPLPPPARVQVQLRSGWGWVKEAHNLDQRRPEIIGWIYCRRWTCIFFLWAESVTCPRFLKRPANFPVAWMISLGQNGKGDKVSRSHETVATWVKVSQVPTRESSTIQAHISGKETLASYLLESKWNFNYFITLQICKTIFLLYLNTLKGKV